MNQLGGRKDEISLFDVPDNLHRFLGRRCAFCISKVYETVNK
jgi:hypothetical protein